MTAVNSSWMHPSVGNTAGASHMQWAPSALQHQNQHHHTQSFDIDLECAMRSEITDSIPHIQQEAVNEGFPRRRSASFDSLEQLQQPSYMERRPASLTFPPPHFQSAAGAASKPRGRASIDIAALALRAQQTMDDAAAAAAALSAAVHRRQSLDPAAAAAARACAAACGRYSSDVAAPNGYSAGTPSAPTSAGWANSALFASAAAATSRAPTPAAGPGGSSSMAAAAAMQRQSSAEHNAHIHTAGPIYSRAAAAGGASVQEFTAPAPGFYPGHSATAMHPSLEAFNNSSSGKMGRIPTGRRSMQTCPEAGPWHQQQQQQQRVRRSSLDRPSLDLPIATRDQHNAAAAAAAAAAAQQSLLYQRAGSASSIPAPHQQLLQQRYAALSATAPRGGRQSLDLHGRQSSDVHGRLSFDRHGRRLSSSSCDKHGRHSLDVQGRQSMDLQRGPSGSSRLPDAFSRLTEGRKGDPALQGLLYGRTGSGSSSCSGSSLATHKQQQQQQGGYDHGQQYAAAIAAAASQQQLLVHQSSFSFSTPSPSAATSVQQQQQERLAAAAALSSIRAEVQQLQILGQKLAASRAAAAAGSAAAAACDAAAVKHEVAMNQALAAMAALEAAAAGSTFGSQDMTDYSSVITEEEDEGYNNAVYRAAAAAAGNYTPGSSHQHRPADYPAAAAAAAGGDYEQYYESMSRWAGQGAGVDDCGPVDYAGYMPNSAAAAAAAAAAGAMQPRNSDPGRMAAAAAAAAARYPPGPLEQWSTADQRSSSWKQQHQQQELEGFACSHAPNFTGNNSYNTSGGVSGTQAKVQQLRALQQMQANLHMMHEELALLQLLPNMGNNRQH